MSATREDMIKANSFIDHLMKNPNIRDEPLLIGEGFILNFITQNAAQLQNTFKTPQFFPHLEWKEVIQVLFSNLYQRVEKEVIPITKRFVDSGEFGGLNKISGTSPFPPAFYKEKISGFVSEIIKNRDVRRSLAGVINIFKHTIVEKYLNEIFKRRDYLYNELVRVQKTSLNCDDYIVFIKILLLVRGAAYLKIPLTPDGANRMNINDSKKMPGGVDKYINALTRQLMQQLPMLSEKSIKLGLKSNLREEQTANEDASSRLMYILTERYQNYKPVKTDRGAESPDKSWFAAARKNAGFYGFNRKMLESLYIIAGDNNW